MAQPIRVRIAAAWRKAIIFLCINVCCVLMAAVAYAHSVSIAAEPRHVIQEALQFFRDEQQEVGRIERVLVEHLKQESLVVARARWPERYQIRMGMLGLNGVTYTSHPIFVDIRDHEGRSLIRQRFVSLGERGPWTRPDRTFAVPHTSYKNGRVMLQWCLVIERNGEFVDVSQCHAIEVPMELVSGDEPVIEPVDGLLSADDTKVVVEPGYGDQLRLTLMINAPLPNDVALGVIVVLEQRGTEIGRASVWCGWKYDDCRLVGEVSKRMVIKKSNQVDWSVPITAFIIDSEEHALRGFSCARYCRGVMRVDATRNVND